MYSREPRYRGTHSQATPWTVGPSRLNDELHPIAADAGLSLIAASAKDKVQGRTGAQQQTVFRGRVSAGSAPREVKQLDQYRTQYFTSVEQVNTARERVRATEANLSYSNLRSPAGGT